MLSNVGLHFPSCERKKIVNWECWLKVEWNVNWRHLYIQKVYIYIYIYIYTLSVHINASSLLINIHELLATSLRCCDLLRGDIDYRNKFCMLSITSARNAVYKVAKKKFVFIPSSFILHPSSKTRGVKTCLHVATLIKVYFYILNIKI